jgi:hypothetical protein
VIFQIAFSNIQSLRKKVLVAQANTDADQKVGFVELQDGIVWVLGFIALNRFKGFSIPVLIDERRDMFRLLCCILTIVIARLSWLFRNSS